MQHAAQQRRSFLVSRLTFRSIALSSVLLGVSCLTPDFDGLDPAPAGAGGAHSGGNASGGASMGGEGGNPIADHCKNTTLDDGETDVNCGAECPPCEVDRICTYNSDCQTDNCLAGRCQEPTCRDNVVNQDETDSDCGGLTCDGCETGENCLKDSDCESQSCKSGKCEAASCSDHKKNNDETDVDCGGTACESRCDVGNGCKLGSDCLQPSITDPPTARCVNEPASSSNKVCRLDCPPKTGDCNEQASDGCETRTETSLAHCGGCGERCDPPHVAISLCESGMCQIDGSQPNGGCDPGYADCDGNVENGCEVNLKTNAEHCGTCETECSANNGAPSCKSGICEITCDSGFRDCDDDATSNGCEVNTQTSVNNCGGCGDDDAVHICLPAQPGDAAFCSGGSCGSINCTTEGFPGYGACNGDGVCDDDLSAPENCGVCGESCSAEHGTPGCEPSGGSPAFECAVDSCETGYGDCDDDYENGCEVATQTDKFHCGGCLATDSNPGAGSNCQALADTPSLRVSSATCGDGACAVVCDSGYANCDGNPSNGCEVNLNSNTARCGGCLPTDPNPGNGENCTSKWTNGANSTCSSGGVCQLGCSTNYSNCNSNTGDGCETNTSNNVARCGGCNTYCGGDAAQTNVDTAMCTSSSCVVTCDSGFCPNLSDPERPCTTSTGTVMNCASCGDTCTGTNPFCDLSGTATCKQRFPVEVVKSATLTGTGNNQSVVLNNVAGPGLGRMVLVMIASSSALVANNPVTLNGSNMVFAAKTNAFTDGQPGVVAAYYLTDAALGAAGTKTILVSNSFYYDFVVAYELRYARQDTAPGSAQTWNGTDCTSTPMNIQVSATVTTAGSAIFAGMFAQGTVQTTSTPIGLPTPDVYKAFNANQGTGIHDYRTDVNSTTSVGWAVSTLNGCWSTGLLALVIDPFITE
jgi:hypothetical protein